MQRPDWAPENVDTTRPSVARVYDYYLGGSHNFESDRRFAARVLEVLPDMAAIVRQNRSFLRRAVQHLCAQGVDQFLDLGSGIPTAGNVHEVVEAASPGARILYVDHDPIAVAHSAALLAEDPNAQVLAADLSDVSQVLDAPLLHEHLDLSRPVAVLLVSVLHFVRDDRLPPRLTRAYMEAMVPGSYLVLSHGTVEDNTGASDAEAIYNQDRSPNALRMRTPAEVEAMFGDLTLLDPGVVRIPLWRPESPSAIPAGVDGYPGLAGVARR